eukprot:scaffold5169_cov172-Amphora_coffeaeformis.AAC.20
MASSEATMADKVLRKFQRGKPVKFPLNEEVTSLAVAPSGRFICAGFTDGTVRLFDMTGHFHNKQTSKRNVPGSPMPRSSVVDSKRHQRYGAVACQIHAKGVHTSLRMHVELSEDGLWCFAGVLRGSMELIAISLADLQAAYDQYDEKVRKSTGSSIVENDEESTPNLLDHITVFRHSDAKLRGFGACTRLQNSGRYLLFTGKSIKNIHIWSFDPPAAPGHDPVLVQLYDTSTNGNTISFLQFRRHAATGALQAISKSVDQRLRVWDLAAEEEGKYDYEPKKRPNRPPFQDVPNTEGTLAVAGGLCICGGDSMYNQMSLVSLNVDNLLSEYNHTEMALPGVAPSPVGSSRRMQRGDLKNVVEAYGSVEKANHVILEISDGTLGHYREGKPQLRVMDKLPWYPNMARAMTVGRLPGGWPVAIVALYQASSGRGQLSVWPLEMPPKVELVTSPMVEGPVQAKVDESTIVSTSPGKTDERSLASTMATTPESQLSRHTTEQQSLASADSIGAYSKASTMNLAKPIPAVEVKSTGANEIESVEPAKLARRFSNERDEVKTTTGSSFGDSTKLSRRLSNGSKNKATDSTKATRHKSSDSALVPTKSVQKLTRRPSSETNIEEAKTVRRFSNERPHSAPSVSEANSKKCNPSKTIGVSESTSSFPRKPVAVRPIAPSLQNPIFPSDLQGESKHGQPVSKSPSSYPHCTAFSASKKQVGREDKRYKKSMSKPQSPPSEQPVITNPVATAPKAGEKRPLITPTPPSKAGVFQTPAWQHLSIDSAAQTLSSLKQSPEITKMVVDTPMVAHRLEAASAVTRRSEIKESPLAAEKNPLPIPRILHPSKRASDETKEAERGNSKVTLENQNRVSTPPLQQKADLSTPTLTEQAYSVTPVAGSNRKSAVESTLAAQVVSDQSPLDDSAFEEPSSKRQKIENLEWLGEKPSLPGRRDGQQMRRAIAKECARQRRAIDQKVNSLPSGRASGSLSQLEKLLAEHKAASIFLEKKYV